MNCEELEPWVSAYQDNELDPRRRRIVEAHLASCRDCRAVSDGWADLAQDLRVSLSRLEAPGSLHARVMRRIPAPVSRAGVRFGLPRRQGWLSFALAPAAAAAGWLLWGAHPTSKAPLPPSRVGGTVRSTVVASMTPAEGALQAMFPGDPAGSQLVKLTHPRSNPGERKKPDDHSRIVPTPSAHPGKAQGRRPLESDAVRRLRRLRPRRLRYPLAEYRPLDRRRTRRHHPWQILAARPEPSPGEAAPLKPGVLPHIRVVEYVLPAVQPPIPSSDAGSEYVLRPAQPAGVVEAGFDL